MGLRHDKWTLKVNRHGSTLEIQSKTVYSIIRKSINTFRP